MNRPKIVMMVGLPASGKSFFAEKISQLDTYKGAVIHSSDTLRKELFGDENEQDNNSELFLELHKRIKEDLRAGKSVIYDATNVSYKKRKAFLNELKNINVEKEAFLIATPYEKCLEQNRKRERKVPDYVIKNMLKNFFTPQKYEGFNSVFIIFNRSEAKDFNLTELLSELKEINHDNPHHSLTIGNHCYKCCEILSENYPDSSFELQTASLMHDIGKKLTKEFKNSKGEISETAHYYNHQNVSAYESLFYTMQLNHVQPMLEIANYIQWHMQPFFMQTEKSINKFIKLVGQEFYDNLLKLHEADRKAH